MASRWAFRLFTHTLDIDFEQYITGCAGCPRAKQYQETVVDNRTTWAAQTVLSTQTTISPINHDEDGRLVERGDETFDHDARGFQVAADYSGSEPDPGYAFDGDGNLVRESENGSVKAYYVRSTLLNATIAELTPTGALEEGAVLSNTGSRIAVLKDSEFHFFHVDPSGSYEKHVKVDKSTASKTQYDPTGRKNNYPGPTGAGPCGSFFPPPYNPRTGLMVW